MARGDLSGMGSHHSAAAETVTWLTPRYILDALGAFDLDPCGHPGWETAKRSICLPEDGLAADWSGRVWLNPPYGRQTWAWLDRLEQHGRGTALIFARTETRGFFEQVWSKASAVLFLSGRLTFVRSDGKPAHANSGAPSALVAYGCEDTQLLRVSGLPGAFVQNWSVLV